MQLTKEHIARKAQVGRISLKGKERPVMEIATTGGLWMEVAQDGNNTVVLGAGPHRAVARHIAESQHKGLEWTELSKSEYVDPKLFADILPEYVELTNQFNRVK